MYARHRLIGIPLVPIEFFFRYPSIPPPIVGAFVYVGPACSPEVWPRSRFRFV